MYLHLGIDYIVPLQNVGLLSERARPHAASARGFRTEGRIIELYDDLPRGRAVCVPLGETL